MSSAPSSGIGKFWDTLTTQGGGLDRFMTKWSPEYAIQKVMYEKMGLPAPNPLASAMSGVKVSASNNGSWMGVSAPDGLGSSQNAIQTALMAKLFDQQRGASPAPGPGPGPGKNPYVDTLIRPATAMRVGPTEEALNFSNRAQTYADAFEPGTFEDFLRFKSGAGAFGG